MKKKLLILPIKKNHSEHSYAIPILFKEKLAAIILILLMNFGATAQTTITWNACTTGTILTTNASGHAIYTFGSSDCDAGGFTAENIGTGTVRLVLGAFTNNKILRFDRSAGAVTQYGKFYTTNHSTFNLNSLTLVALSILEDQTLTLSAYKNGSSKGSVAKSFIGNANIRLPFAPVDLGSVFNDIDEIRVSSSCSSCAGVGLDDIIFSAAAPAITQTGTLNAFNGCLGNASATQTFTVSGSSLTGNLNLSAPAGFEISTSSGSGFSGNIPLSPSGGTVNNTTIYTRLASSATGNPSGNISITSSGATSQSVSVSGVVTAPGQWLGGTSTAWGTPANWGCSSAPVSSTNVTIPASGSNMPVVNITGAVCNNLTINSGAQLSINVNRTLNIKGAVSGAGAFTHTSGKVIFSGTTQTIPAGNYTDLEIGGSGTKILAGNVQVNNTLTLTNGYISLQDNNLSIGNAGSISGGTSAAFILITGNGTLRQQNIGSTGRSGPVLFPVGTTSYTPVSITNGGTTDGFSVKVLSNVYDTYDDNDVPTGVVQTSNNVNRTWIIKEDTEGGSNASISFQWNISNELPDFDHNACFASHYTENAWHSGSLETASGSGPYTITLSDVQSFSPFGIGSAGSVLPLRLLSFTGQAAETNDLLKWSTTDEINVSAFIIERSADSKNFSEISSVPARNTSTRQQYEFTDKAVNLKTAYYRLKMVDSDQTYSYSRIINIDNNNVASQDFFIFPNPATSVDILKIKAQTTVDNNVRVSIIDAVGRENKKMKIEASTLNNGSAGITINTLPAGSYFLKIQDEKNNTTNVLRFLKQ